jgi:hypothetical protein|eukprot:COSAG01_NODE_1397_length_10467_cov_9.010706_2_plen_168_part_00
MSDSTGPPLGVCHTQLDSICDEGPDGAYRCPDGTDKADCSEEVQATKSNSIALALTFLVGAAAIFVLSVVCMRLRAARLRDEEAGEASNNPSHGGKVNIPLDAVVVADTPDATVELALERILDPRRRHMPPPKKGSKKGGGAPIIRVVEGVEFETSGAIVTPTRGAV